MGGPNGRIGAVVIGRNEGGRLALCLRSVRAQIADVVYVDSGSADGSIERATQCGARALALANGPYTAARGRQAGMEELLRGNPAIEYVQFVDGDCVLQPGWVEAAMRVLDEHRDVAAVCGRRREEGTRFYGRVVDVDWDIAPGDVPYFGGDLMARVTSIVGAGGWPVELIAGEEPDLSFRLRDRGERIVRLPAEATLHDVAMTRFGQYWRRSVRSGHAYAEVGWRQRGGWGRVWMWRAASILLYGALAPAASAAGALMGLVWIWAWALVAIAALAYARLLASMWRGNVRRGYAPRLSAWYAALNTVCKVAGAIGVLKWMISCAAGRRTKLIEYKAAREGAAEVKGMAA